MPEWNGEDNFFDFHSIKGVEYLKNLEKIYFYGMCDPKLLHPLRKQGIHVITENDTPLDIWGILGINETTDIHIIKKARNQLLNTDPRDLYISHQEVELVYRYAIQYATELIKKLGRPYDNRNYEEDKMTFDQEFYTKHYLKNPNNYFYHNSQQLPNASALVEYVIIQLAKILTNDDEAVKGISDLAKGYDYFYTQKEYKKWCDDVLWPYHDRHSLNGTLNIFTSWLSCHNFCAVIRWNDSPTVILKKLVTTNTKLSYDIDFEKMELDDYYEYNDITLKILNTHLKKQGYELIILDTSGDCYYVFILKQNKEDVNCNPREVLPIEMGARKLGSQIGFKFYSPEAKDIQHTNRSKNTQIPAYFKQCQPFDTVSNNTKTIELKTGVSNPMVELAKILTNDDEKIVKGVVALAKGYDYFLKEYKNWCGEELSLIDPNLWRLNNNDPVLLSALFSLWLTNDTRNDSKPFGAYFDGATEVMDIISLLEQAIENLGYSIDLKNIEIDDDCDAVAVLEIINQHIKNQGYELINLDTDSDSYTIFIVPIAKHAFAREYSYEVVNLGKEIGFKFDTFVANYIKSDVSLDKLFDEKDVQWGLRGSQHLWRDLKIQVMKVNYYDGGFFSEKDFENFIYESIPRILEQKKAWCLNHKVKNNFDNRVPYKAERDKLYGGGKVFVEDYNHGGMSSGVISLQYWKDVTIPLLVERHVCPISENDFQSLIITPPKISINLQKLC